MASFKPEVIHDIFPYLRQYKDGTIERLAGTEYIEPGLDPKTGVTSEDVVIEPKTGVSARIYQPTTTSHKNLPLLIYLHGGAFLIASTGEPKYHNFLNLLASSSKSIVISINYRKAPENPLPVAYDDAWAAIRWVAAQSSNREKSWANAVDFERVILVGDSAGASMGHFVGCRIRVEDPGHGFKLKGIIHIHPYFWGKEPIGSEGLDSRKEMVDKWWEFVCPSDKGCDDPLINPFVDGAPRIDELACERLLVCVAEKDVLKDRGRAYYDRLVETEWKGKGEIFESMGEDHVFQIFDPASSKAVELFNRLAEFINGE